MQTAEPYAHYPYVTRRLLHLFSVGKLTNIQSIDVEPDYEYVAHITYKDGSHRITYGNDLGINTGAAISLASDKGHTKFLLRTLGVTCPAGEVFLMPTWARHIEESPRAPINTDVRTIADADAYIRSHFGYPVYIKPVDGSKGANIFNAHNVHELNQAFAIYEQKKVRVALIEEPIAMPDYRIVTLDGKLISAYQRIPLTVTGDGRQTILQLLTDLQAQYRQAGRDTTIATDDTRLTAELERHSLSLTSVPDAGEMIALLPISNLSAGGTSVDVTEQIDPRWVELASYIADNFGLRLSGLDLACADITDCHASYSVLEVNGTPGLDHFASSGTAQQQLVDDLYATVLNVTV